MPRVQASFAKTAVALIGGPIGAIVLVLSIYFPSRQLETMHAHLVAKTEMYASLMSHQLEPAIAFGDQETAREVLEAFARDPDVISAAVTDASGAELFRIGTPPAPPTRQPARIELIEDAHDGVAAIAPIVAHEGPRGVAVVQISTKSLQASHRQVIWIGIGVGLAMLVLGSIAGYGLTRVVARREQAHMQAVNEQLEHRIAKRTTELRAANEKLVTEMKRRTEIELELLQAQKLESVGRLAAGVAHELNTPIQFVSDSCTFMRDAVSDVLSLTSGAGELIRAVRDGASTPDEAVAAYDEAAENASMEDLNRMLPNAVRRALDGLERMATIVQSMKEFSHPGDRQMGEADVNRGIQNTLEIARNEYKYVADVKTDFGELPPIYCNLGELNQVFLNIIVNAAHAIKDVVDGSSARGTISIRTWLDHGTAKISFSDTGTGIPPEIRAKIFEPFFTTKEVGKGTGQGLAIARSIVVDKHGGTLELESEVGAGTTFIISIPIVAAETARAEAA